MIPYTDVTLHLLKAFSYTVVPLTDPVEIGRTRVCPPALQRKGQGPSSDLARPLHSTPLGFQPPRQGASRKTSQVSGGRVSCRLGGLIESGDSG